MKKLELILLGIVVPAALFPPAAQARYDEHDAERDCERVASRDHRYKGTRSVRVEELGKHDYRVTGNIRMDGNDPYFVCSIRDKRVVDWYVEGDRDRDRYGRNDPYDRYSPYGGQRPDYPPGGYGYRNPYNGPVMPFGGF